MTPNDIKDLSFDGLKVDFDDPEPIQRIIDGVITSIETYLNRPLMRGVFKQYADFEHDEWVPIVTPVNDYDGKKRGAKLFSDLVDEIEYDGGYDDLPDDIKQVVFRLVVYEINKAMQNDYGLVNKVVVSGSTESSIQIDQRDFIDKQLGLLKDYKNMSFYQSVERVGDAGTLTYQGNPLSYNGELISYP